MVHYAAGDMAAGLAGFPAWTFLVVLVVVGPFDHVSRQPARFTSWQHCCCCCSADADDAGKKKQQQL